LLSVSATCTTVAPYTVFTWYLHENTAYSSKKQGKNMVGTVFSLYAQALVYSCLLC
jgi:hypothetical protein